MKKNDCRVLGIDACKEGWIVAEIKEKGLQIMMYEQFVDIIDAHKLVDLIWIDIPIGLPESIEEAEKRPEGDARKLLPKKASSVFTVPCRRATEEASYEAANRANKHVLGKGISKQSYYIMKKALEVNRFLENHEQYIDIIMESHPELQFAQLTETKLPILASKKTAIGRNERESLLVEILHTQLYMQVNFQEFSLYVRFPDDVIDAVCLAVAARLGLENGCKTIPENAGCNRYGIPMKMTYYSK